MRKNYKITVLSDNQKADDTLEAEKGLCVFLDTGNLRILLDTGASGQFIRNAQRLNIDLKETDYVFISHGHADHIGGLIPFLEINAKAKILLSEKALNQSFFSTRNGTRNIGIDFNLEKYKERCVLIERVTHLKGDLCIFPCEIQSFSKPKANSTLFRDTGYGLELDDFNHELVFCCGTEELLVYTGCAHKGLLNILDSVNQIMGKTPEIVFGGFHLLDSKPGQLFETASEIGYIGKCLRNMYPKTRFLTGHCTGTHTFEILKNQLNRQIELFYTGYGAHF